MELIAIPAWLALNAGVAFAAWIHARRQRRRMQVCVGKMVEAAEAYANSARLERDRVYRPKGTASRPEPPRRIASR